MTNYPTSDTQFLAQMLVKTRNGDQITTIDAHRLEEIAEKGHSSPAPEADEGGQI